VAILYGGSIFACRRCYQLAYPSQQESAAQRALHKVQAIRIELGGSANLMYPFPLKPKHMHSTTYDRLRLQADQALKDVLAEMRSLSSAK
jgi:hypothetical protein